MDIEKKLFSDYNEKVNDEYKTKVRSLALNLKSKINPGLREGVVTGEISIHQLCTMNTEVRWEELAASIIHLTYTCTIGYGQ